MPEEEGETETEGGRLTSSFLCPQGDSGGPLVCDNRAYGVIAYGKRGEISSGVFTKVVYFLPWISKNTELL